MNSKSKSARPNAAPSPRPAAGIAAKIRARTRTPAFQRWLRNLLVELCRVDTTPKAKVKEMLEAEDRCFRIIERELASLPFAGARSERRRIDPAIQNSRHYSPCSLAKTADRSRKRSAAEIYSGRSNLLYLAPGSAGRPGASVALNAHLDVVAPFYPPRLRRGSVLGRGACDDKGPLVSMIAALKVLSAVMTREGLRWNRNVLAMFVIEEEIGGNGSLSLALDRKLKNLYDVLLVGEPTSLKIHPANRGAVWYRAALKPPSGVSAFEMAAFVIDEFEREGAALRAESRHELFPQRPVQTCHGLLGSFGEHPSRICARVIFKIRFSRKPAAATERLVRDCLERGLADYVGLYGDKTEVMDSATRKPMVRRHYDFRRTATGFEITVHGAAGHMGAIRERDGAITKTASLVRSLFDSKAKLAAVAGPFRLELGSEGHGRNLVLEGGQGFLPTHRIEEVMERMRRAAHRGAENYLRRCGRNDAGAEVVAVTYDKLHNAAFAGDPDSPAMRIAVAAAKAAGIWDNEPVRGWTVSCDARLFATEYPGMPVLTFGPGELARAHSDDEQIALTDIVKAVEFLSLFLLQQTGTVTKL